MLILNEACGKQEQMYGICVQIEVYKVQTPKWRAPTKASKLLQQPSLLLLKRDCSTLSVIFFLHLTTKVHNKIRVPK